MLRRIVTALAFSLVSLSAWAIPGVNVQFQTDTTAIAEGVADAHSNAGPQGDAPLITSSTVVGATDFAASSGIAAAGLLSSSAEADSALGFASAVGSVRYLATFSNMLGAVLHLNFSSSDSTSTNAYSSGSLSLRVVSNGVTMWDEVFTTTAVFDRQLSFASAAAQSVELLLASEANTFTGGSAFNSALLTFDVTPVPEPGTGLLLGTALFLMLIYRRQMASRK